MLHTAFCIERPAWLGLQDERVATEWVYLSDGVKHRPGVFHRTKLANDLEEFPIWSGKAVPLPEPDPPAAEEGA